MLSPNQTSGGERQHVAFRIDPENPDAEDGYQRRDDRDDQKWPFDAAEVSSISHQLAAGQSGAAVDEQVSTVSIETAPLTQSEVKIVRSWFRQSEAVRFDRWFDIMNGRHRLWATLEHFKDELAPVAGDALGFTDPLNTKALGDD